MAKNTKSEVPAPYPKGEDVAAKLRPVSIPENLKPADERTAFRLKGISVAKEQAKQMEDQHKQLGFALDELREHLANREEEAKDLGARLIEGRWFVKV